jgi:3-hydroxyisobutyrate dehydrogenase
MEIGVAGLGRMGAAIAARLIEVGHKLTVWNRSPEKAKPLQAAGAALARSPRELAEKVEAVITILTDAAAIEAVYEGPSGLLAGNVSGKLFIEMSTVRPQTAIDLAARVRAKGAGFVECPVGGTVGPARQGKLVGLMGAEENDAACAKPILEQLCRRLEHVGPVGNGAVMKLAINLPLMVYWQALGEALALSRKVELDPSRLMDLLPTPRAAPTRSRCGGPRSPPCSRAEMRGRSVSRSTAGSRTCASCKPKARRAASSCRWSSGRLPASSGRAATAGAAAMDRACRSIGPKRPVPSAPWRFPHSPCTLGGFCADAAVGEGISAFARALARRVDLPSRAMPRLSRRQSASFLPLRLVLEEFRRTPWQMPGS